MHWGVTNMYVYEAEPKSIQSILQIFLIKKCWNLNRLAKGLFVLVNIMEGIRNNALVEIRLQITA